MRTKDGEKGAPGRGRSLDKRMLVGERTVRNLRQNIVNT